MDEAPFIPEPKLGDVLAGKYRLDSVVGEGGMGTVFAAHHTVLDQKVAVKVLAPELAQSREIAERFLHEARAAAKLQSEHVARVMDAGTAESGLPFFVMECLEGFDLGELQRIGGPPLPAEEVADYALQALEGLAHAHHAGIIHRDIKPGNLFLATRAGAPSVIKVLDFGISKATTGRAGREFRTLTGGHQVIGSPGYMSPEQVRDSSNVDARTDIWSLGVVMYELLTARPAFEGEGPIKIFAAILDQGPSSVRSLRADIPEGLDTIVMCCLERDREKRFRDVSELARALAPYGSGRSFPLVERIEQLLRDVPKPKGGPSRPSGADDAVASTEAARSADAPAGLPKRGSLVLPVFLLAALLVGVGLYLAQASGVAAGPFFEAGAGSDSTGLSVTPTVSAHPFTSARPVHSVFATPTHSGILKPKPKPHR
jgi:serine/threonine protein kinase